MKKLGTDDKGVKKLEIDAAHRIVTGAGTVLDGKKGDAGATRYQLENVVMDFRKCTDEDIMALCGREVLTWIQGQWNKAQAKDRFAAGKWERIWDVKSEMIDVERRSRAIDPFTAAMAGMGTFSAEQLATLQKALADAAKAKK
jgi:hypothetical protein